MVVDFKTKLNEKLRHLVKKQDSGVIIVFQIGNNWYKTMVGWTGYLPLEFVYRANIIIDITSNKVRKSCTCDPKTYKLTNEEIKKYENLPFSTKEEIAEKEKITLFPWNHQNRSWNS